MKFVSIAAILLALVATTACSPVVEYHGYFAKPDDVTKIKESEMTQREVEMMLGSPSTKASFDDNKWYYIASVSNSFAWKAPEVVTRHVIAITFNDATKVVEDVAEYTIEDGRVIAFSGDVTRTRGRELSVLEQLLGNVGRVSADQITDQTQGQ